jgi:transposase
MTLAAADLPRDVDALHGIVLQLAADNVRLVAERDLAKNGLIIKSLEYEKLRIHVARLQRMKFGQSSERFGLFNAQPELGLDEPEAETATETPEGSAPSEPTTDKLPRPPRKRRTSSRLPLPSHLPRRDVHLHPDPVCPSRGCGGAMRKVGADITEILDYTPASFHVVRYIRPSVSCRKCETMVQLPIPVLPIPRARVGAGLLAHILVSKYCDHLPFYRVNQIFARSDVEIDRATMADWSGKFAREATPLVEAIARYVKAGQTLHVDDTPFPVLAPGHGKTRTGRVWIYLRDGSSYGDTSPPAVFYRFTPDRQGQHPQKEPGAFAGFLHADGYSGFNQLYKSGDKNIRKITEVGCWAHFRRKTYDVHVSTKSPIASKILARIGRLFAIERIANGKSASERRQLRQAEARPVINELARYLDGVSTQIPRQSALAKAINYARARWTALTVYLDNGMLEISNNAAERGIRPLTLGRKNFIFMGSESGGRTGAAMYSLIRSAQINGLNPEAYLKEIIERLPTHPIKRIEELLPWNIALRNHRDQDVDLAA